MESKQSFKTIRCKDCGSEFTLSKKEESFFRHRGLKNPKRCKPCRLKKRREQAQSLKIGEVVEKQ